MAPPSLKRYALLSLVAAVLTIVLKGGAYHLTGSVALLSDALESLVNLVTAIVTLIALSIAVRPADEEHAYGHTKAEYFASGFEGGLIVIAAIIIGMASVLRLINPRPIEAAGIGLGIAVLASLINLGVSRALFRAARRYDSIALEADAHHLLTDVWTTGGVVVGVGAAALTGWLWLDAVAAIAVAAHIIFIGVDLLRRSALGLLDTSLPEETRGTITAILDAHAPEGIRYHALRTRQAGAHRFISLHILVPGHWTVKQGHDLLEKIEGEIRAAVPNSTIFTHLEPIEDPLSWVDIGLERPGNTRPPLTPRTHLGS
jgi:cation diffusion facilitator family transporter